MYECWYVGCGAPANRFFSGYDEYGKKTVYAPVCDAHVKFAYIPDKFFNDKEISEEEYAVWKIMDE